MRITLPSRTLKNKSMSQEINLFLVSPCLDTSPDKLTQASHCPEGTCWSKPVRGKACVSSLPQARFNFVVSLEKLKLLILPYSGRKYSIICRASGFTEAHRLQLE